MEMTIKERAEKIWKADPEKLIIARLKVLRAQGEQRVTANQLAYWVRNTLGIDISINGGAKQIGKILGPHGLCLRKFGKDYIL
jgi:hypothetical protein